MKLVLEFDMNNAAFEEQPASEAASILTKIADLVAGGVEKDMIRDTNGNLIGSWAVKE